MRKVIVAALAAFALSLGVAACDIPVPMATTAAEAEGRQFEPAPAGKAALYIIGSRVVALSPVTVGAATVGTVVADTWLRVDLPAGRYDVRFAGRDNIASRVVDLAPGSMTFLEITFTTGFPIYHRIEEMPPEAGRAAVMKGRRVQELQP